MSQTLIGPNNNRAPLLSPDAARGVLTSIDWRSAAAFGLPFVLYLLTLAPTVFNLDSAEFTTAAATGGIVRATGYPLYLMLGRLWALIPIGDMGFRMNVLSALCGALTVALADRVLRRLNVGPWAALGALSLLATASFFWAMSLIAEVYTLHTAFMAGIILLLLRWAHAPAGGRLAVVGLALGLSAGNHVATVLLLPGCAWYVLTVARRRALAPRALFLAMAGFVAGICTYLYLPLNQSFAPEFNYAGQYDAAGGFVPLNLRTLAGLWWLISGRSFSGEMLAYSGIELWREILHFGAQLWRAFFAIGIGPGVVGLFVLLRRDWRLGGMFLLLFAVNAGFYIDYAVVDKDTMFLPAYLIWALWIGVGTQWLLEWLLREDNALIRQWGPIILRGTLTATAVLAVVWNWRLTDLSDDWSARRQGEKILSLAEPNALILGWWDTVPVIEYLQLVEGQRPDVKAINRFLISPKDMGLLIRREVLQRPVYIDNVPEELKSLMRAQRAGPIYRLRPR